MSGSAHSYRDILSFLRHHAERSRDKPFVHLELPDVRGTVSFSDAWKDVCRCRAELTHAGVPGEGVALVFLPQSWEAIAYYFGAILHGCTVSLMPCPSPKQDPDRYWTSHVKLAELITPVVLITNDKYAAEIERNGLLADWGILHRARPRHDKRKTAATEAAPAETLCDGLDPGRIPILQHSSGTTGLKKGVMLTHRAILAQVASYAKAIQATENDVVVSWLPLYHDMGLVACLLAPMILGQTIVLLDPFYWVSRPSTLFEAITRYRGTLCWLPNFAFDHLVRTVEPDSVAMKLNTMRAFINCSEPCQAQTFHRFVERFGPLGLPARALQICYAMAETTFAATQTPMHKTPTTVGVDRTVLHEHGRASPPLSSSSEQKLISVGCPIDGVRISVRDTEGRPVPDGVVGEICVASTSLFEGYHNLSGDTALRVQSGFLFTRDRGFTQNGDLYVLGRLDDLIIVAGRNFHAAEIEDVLNQVPGLKAGRSVAFGVANSDRGTSDLIVVAETLDDDAADSNSSAYRKTRSAMRHAIYQTLGIYPAEIKLVSQGWLLKTTSGKIERNGNAGKYIHERHNTMKEGLPL